MKMQIFGRFFEFFSWWSGFLDSRLRGNDGGEGPLRRQGRGRKVKVRKWGWGEVGFVVLQKIGIFGVWTII